MATNFVEILKTAAQKIKEAPAVLIGAGAGMSAAAGIDYTDEARFRQLFPVMHRRGFHNNYELMGFQGLSEAIMWGYHAMHVQHVAYDNQTAEVYQDLLALVRSKDYFVLTSNVDTMFAKNGFDPERIFTPQGNYKLMQCLRPCSQETYDTRPFLDKLLANLDPVTHEITDLTAIPRCPKCGGAMFMNVRGGHWFIEKPYQTQRQQFQQWVQAHLGSPLVLMDMGTGFNTPSVVRWPMEQITHHNPEAFLLRFNLDHPAVPAQIASRSLEIGMPIDAALREVVRNH
ncbi:NAD-dependent protein deacetylase, SIR2 family [Flexibacter flexilis DSM 6793]|uniref:NAD-dependent protein deacetylase, SIR2 family n=1 Tax=Flexibacter flexilis DSM 6793 TaxID=927664 RepID=A0A1I1L3I2_9BACT|nr:hypothetical protein [Flexibacter flexilis]SFC67616.1 NAD-dependent protein deacetylase, SIR2 family [Flexibacter flexilis DSM 6793]